MSKMIYWELDYVFSCILWGLFLMLLYDMLRIERRVWKRGSIWVSIEDILYWSFAAIGTFRLFYQQDNGVIRWFAIAATFFMMLFINRFISRWAVPLISRILRIPVRFLEKTIKKTVGFFRKILRIFMKRLQLRKKKATIKKQEHQKERQKKLEEQKNQKQQKKQKRQEERQKRSKEQEYQKQQENRNKKENTKDSQENKKNQKQQKNKNTKDNIRKGQKDKKTQKQKK